MERRKLPKALIKGMIMEATSCTASMVVFTELTNSDDGTFKHSDCRRSVRELVADAVHIQSMSINKGFNSLMLNGGAILELSIDSSEQKINTGLIN